MSNIRGCPVTVADVLYSCDRYLMATGLVSGRILSYMKEYASDQSRILVVDLS